MDVLKVADKGVIDGALIMSLHLALCHVACQQAIRVLAHTSSMARSQKAGMLRLSNCGGL